MCCAWLCWFLGCAALQTYTYTIRALREADQQAQQSVLEQISPDLSDELQVGLTSAKAATPQESSSSSQVVHSYEVRAGWSCRAKALRVRLLCGSQAAEERRVLMHVCVCVPAPAQVRLVLEYCDKGCLRDALDNGIFLLGEL